MRALAPGSWTGRPAPSLSARPFALVFRLPARSRDEGERGRGPPVPEHVVGPATRPVQAPVFRRRRLPQASLPRRARPAGPATGLPRAPGGATTTGRPRLLTVPLQGGAPEIHRFPLRTLLRIRSVSECHPHRNRRTRGVSKEIVYEGYTVGARLRGLVCSVHP